MRSRESFSERRRGVFLENRLGSRSGHGFFTKFSKFQQHQRYNNGGEISLFVDGIPRTTSVSKLKEFFEKEGMLTDIYISKKVRTNREDLFGFVRYRDRLEAERAIRKFNGSFVSGSKIRVSVAKYQRGGIPFYGGNLVGKMGLAKKQITFPPLRDSRDYRDVLKGKKHPGSSNAMEFGFVRFRDGEEVEKILQDLSGQNIEGGLILIPITKYRKGGLLSGVGVKGAHYPFKKGPRRAEVRSSEMVGVTSSQEPIKTPVLSSTGELMNVAATSDKLVENVEKMHNELVAPEPVLQAPAAVNGESSTGCAAVGVKGLQGTVGDDLRTVDVCLSHEPTEPTQPQKCFLVLANSGTKQAKGHVNLTRAKNPRDVAMFLGFYSNAKEEATQKNCDL